jgi:hypothetical protein
MANKTIRIDADAFVSWPPLFRHLWSLWVPDANDGESQSVNGASRGRAQGVRGYGTV